jgi:predicted transcriptional regulator
VSIIHQIDVIRLQTLTACHLQIMEDMMILSAPVLDNESKVVGCLNVQSIMFYILGGNSFTSMKPTENHNETHQQQLSHISSRSVFSTKVFPKGIDKLNTMSSEQFHDVLESSRKFDKVTVSEILGKMKGE